MHDAPRTLTPCHCGGTFFRVDTTVPAVFYISDTELSMDLNPVYRSDLTELVIECQDCHASMDLSGVRDEDGEPVDPNAKPALDAALSELLEHLRYADIMTEVTTSF